MIRAAGSECRSDFRGLPAHAPAVRSLPLAITRAKCVQGLVHPRRWNAFRPSVQGITLNGTGPRPTIATLSQHQGQTGARAQATDNGCSTARAVARSKERRSGVSSDCGFQKFHPVGFARPGPGGCFAHTVSTVEPMVLRDSRSRCACAASFSG
jgi:hypothetical protein